MIITDSKINVLIVEDEWITSEEIKEVLEANEIRVVGQTDNAEEALALTSENKVDVALLDIHIKGQKDGIELAEEISKIRSTAIIFLTAFDDAEYISRAKQVLPAAYLIKPFQAKSLMLSIEMAFNNLLSGNGQEEVKEENVPINDRIFIKENHLLVRIMLKDILYIQATGSYSVIHTKKGTHTLSINLKNFEKRLSHPDFYRVHRSYLVNIAGIEAINGNLIQINEASIPIGPSQRAEVLTRFKLI